MNFSSVIAVVLAGGKGTRVSHLLPDLPKPMAPVLGRPFLEWVVRFLVGQGITRIVLSTGYKAGVITSHFNSLNLPGIRISCIREGTPLGTAGGFLQATGGETPEGWLILNGDSLALTSLASIFEAVDRADGALLGLEMDDAGRYGTLVQGPDRELRGFTEKRPGAGLINAGIYLLRHSLLPHFPDERPLSFETQVFPGLIAGGARLRTVPVKAPFLDIGTPETLGQAEYFVGAHRVFFDERN